MVNVRERAFLISGSNFPQRQHALRSIKKRLLQGKTSEFSILTLYSKEVNPSGLAEQLFTVSFTDKKVIVFKNFQALPSAALKLIFGKLTKILINNYLIFETEKDYYQLKKDKKFSNDSLFSFILGKSASFKVSSLRKKLSIDDFINSIRKNDLSHSLYVLENLFEGTSKDKILGPQIIGMLVKKFSYIRDPFKKIRYFKYLWEADRLIKEKGLDSRLVIETLLVKLFNLQ